MTGRQSAIVSLVGAILAAVGGVLPWATLGALEVSGLRGDGILALGGGVIAALAAFVAMGRSSNPARIVITLIGVLLTLLYVSKIGALVDLGDATDIFSVGIGPGIWIGLVGSVLMALFGWSARGEVAKAGPSEKDAVATLSQLADLRDRGAITEAEYESKKAELLARL